MERYIMHKHQIKQNIDYLEDLEIRRRKFGSAILTLSLGLYMGWPGKDRPGSHDGAESITSLPIQSKLKWGKDY